MLKIINQRKQANCSGYRIQVKLMRRTMYDVKAADISGIKKEEIFEREK
jgi:hypothetical protein